MFGLGWGWPVAATLALLVLIGLARILLSDTTDNEKTPGAPDRDANVDELWHQYEEGDITRQEFERLRQKRVA